jgi:tetratricopeptide (TPR) repeat protein
VIILLFGALIYSNSLRGPFILDDLNQIIENPGIRHVWPPTWLDRGLRPFAYLTLALNYSAHGLDVQGYHIVNVLIHLLAGLVFFGIVRRTLRLKDLRERYGEHANWIALGTALVWMSHPLQTQSVNYVTQRMESLMGLFYFMTVWGFIAAQQSEKKLWWYSLSIVACGLGMATKEVIATAPIIVLSFDRCFVANTWRQIVQTRKLYYTALGATWIILAFFGPWSALDTMTAGPLPEVLSSSADSGSAPVTVTEPALTPVSYALSQPGVICHYLRLCFLPVGQCLDPWWPVAKTPIQIVPPTLLIVALLAVTFWSMYRHPKWGFLGWWFFLILAPTSTVVPIADLAFEHRMYLPLAAVAALFVIGGLEIVRHRKWMTPRSWMVVVLPTVTLLLGILTFVRNQDYQSAVKIWSDVVEKAPHNPRALNNYGLALDEEGELAEALTYFHEVIRVHPDYQQLSDVYMNAGSIHRQLKNFEDAVQYNQKALNVEPRNYKAMTNLGIVLITNGDAEAALPHFEKAIELSPNNAEFHTNLGQALIVLKRREDATRHFLRALELDPRCDRARYNLQQSKNL